MNDKPFDKNSDQYRHYGPLTPDEIGEEVLLSPPERAEAELRELIANSGGSAKALDEAKEPDGEHFDQALWDEAQGNEDLYFRLKGAKDAERLAMENPDDAAYRVTLSIMKQVVQDMKSKLGIGPETTD